MSAICGSKRQSNAPAVVHVTHWKAGSTWVDAILRRCVPGCVVEAQRWNQHVHDAPLEEGKVYPRAYLTKEQFEDLSLPERWKRFVVIRDLRDTFVSAYFSIKFSHNVIDNHPLQLQRQQLHGMSLQEGLHRTLSARMVANSALIQQSWAAAGERFVRYEDLVRDDLGTLQTVLIEECAIGVNSAMLRAAVKLSRFAAASGGRAPGNEDPHSHHRKGVVGDWRNYLRGSLKDAFRERYGELLVATGYERDLDW
jgi:lipopolysaccharide transport system ATP-binding protein